MKPSYFLVLQKLLVWISIFAISLAPINGNASSCCACEDEFAGFWWSRGPGRVALLAGAAVTLGVVVGVLATQSNKHDHSSSSSQQNNTADGGVITTNTANTAGTQVATNGLTNFNQLAGLSKTPTQTQTKKEPTILTFDCHVTIQSEEAHLSTCTPFVICPDGKKIEAASVNLQGKTLALTLPPITIQEPSSGLYQVGVQQQVHVSFTPYVLIMNTAMQDSKSEFATATTQVFVREELEILHTFHYN